MFVDVDVDKTANEIIITGVKQAVYDVERDILQLLMKMEQAEDNKKLADYTESGVEWEYQPDENEEEWKKFHWKDILV